MAHYSINWGKQRMKLMLEKILHIQSLEKKINKAFIALAPDEQKKVLPPAPYTLSKNEKNVL